MFFHSLKKEMLIFALALAILIIIVTTTIGVLSTQTAGEDAARATSEVLRKQAEESLLQIAMGAAEQQDSLFAQIKDDTENLASYIKNIYENPLIFSRNEYWKFDGHVVRKDGRYLNAASDVSTIHVPSFAVLDADEKRNIELTANLDFVVPSMLEHKRDIAALYTIDTKGVTRYFPNIVLGNLAPPDYDPREDIYYKPASPEGNPEKRTIWSSLYDDVAGRGPMITATAPVYTSKGFRGIVGTDVLLANIIKTINTYSPIEGSYAFLIDKEGNTIAFPDKARRDLLRQPPKKGEERIDLIHREISSEFSAILKEMAGGKTGFGSIQSGTRGLFMAYAPLKQTGFSMAIVAEETVMLKAVGALRAEISESMWNTTVFRTLPSSLLIVALASVISIFLVARVVQPIQQLTAGAREISLGNLDYTLHVKSKNEIGELADSFNQMGSTLKKSQQELYEYSKGLEQKVKERTLELEKANEQLEELDKRKSEFVSFASHQLRSPLTAIKGYASMLLEGSFGALPKQAMDATNKMFLSSQRLSGVINDYLLISRIEQGRLTYEFQDVELWPIIERVASELKQEFSLRNLFLKLEPPKEGSRLTVRADSGKIAQVVNNLLDNAMKYTPQGGVTLALSEEGVAALRLKIADTGIGMDKDDTEKLFQKFSRAANAPAAAVGVGLGLYLVATIVKAHGGKVWAESLGRGKGSVFYLELPLAGRADAPAPLGGLTKNKEGV